MMRKYLIWFLIGPLVIALGIFGWQYMRNRSLEQLQKTLAANKAQEQQPYLPPAEQQQLSPEVQNRQTLSEAIKRFRAAKSLRVKLTQPTSQGVVTGELEYVKPMRLHATLNTPDKQILEMIIIGETVYVRTGKDTWEMSNDAFAKDYGRSFFATMFITDDTLASFGIADDAPITLKQDPSKCVNYTTQYKQNDKMMGIQFCINANKDITIIKIQTVNGETTSEYRDYNSLFMIERPRMPLLQPKMPGQESTSTGA
ncbi:MAG: hypothetical protein PHC53_00295 [Patescibacteria group bacterium]|nr:hypothetical protein [Patescibacteria group bacterium]